MRCAKRSKNAMRLHQRAIDNFDKMKKHCFGETRIAEERSWVGGVLKDERPMTPVPFNPWLQGAVLRQRAPCAHARITLRRVNWYEMT